MFRNFGIVALVGLTWVGASLASAEESARDYTTRAVQLVKEGKTTEALEAFSKAIELAPNDPLYYRNRAALYAHLKQWD
jgi:Tfp pilus assembly protein PilF